jgi:hypothetical protein
MKRHSAGLPAIFCVSTLYDTRDCLEEPALDPLSAMKLGNELDSCTELLPFDELLVARALVHLAGSPAQGRSELARRVDASMRGKQEQS